MLGHWTWYPATSPMPMACAEPVARITGQKPSSKDSCGAFAAGSPLRLALPQIVDESRLPGEPAEGVADIHFHPALPRTARLNLSLTF